MPPSKYQKVSIIGAGSVGSTLGRALFEKGYPIVSIISRTGQSAIALAKAVQCKKASTQIEDVDPSTKCIIIGTNDGAIPHIVKQLAGVKKLKFKKLFAAHTSGVLSSDVLEPLRKMGVTVASIHPIQTFPHLQKLHQSKSLLKNIYYGIDGEQLAIVRAEKIVHDLGGKSVIVSKEMKPLYHVACVFASGYMMIFLNAINELSKQLKLKASWTEVFGPLMTTAMENTVKHSAGEALTGPVLRGDHSTIELHLKTLAHYAPEFLPLYTVGGIEVARVAKRNGRIKQEDFEQTIAQFKKFLKSNSFTKISKVND